MRGILQFSCLSWAFAFSATALAQEPNSSQTPVNEPQPAAGAAKGTSGDATAGAPSASGGKTNPVSGVAGTAALAAGGSTSADAQATPSLATPPPSAPAEPAPPPKADEWQFVTSGYFRGPIMISLSDRADPGNPNGPTSTQMTFAPNRLMDAGYSSFAYTRLQEGDWGEIYFTEKRKHVAATIGLQGYWYPWAGYERAMTGWMPAQGWVTLDTDFELGGLKPNIELKAGIFPQRWGIFGIYDTYLFGRFHQAGEALQLKVPLTPDLEVRLVHGIGTNRNGKDALSPPTTTGTVTGLTLLHYAHAGINYKKMVDVGLYYNNSWTKDPSLFAGANPVGGGPYSEAKDANMTVVGADLNVNLPTFGHLWLAPGYVSIKNGWALSQTVELMHSPGGRGIAQNYMGLGQAGSTGSGSMFNLGFLYENSLSKLMGQAPAILPDLRLTAFGMLAKTSRDLTTTGGATTGGATTGGAPLADNLTQFKWGADLTLQTLNWLAFMLRYDWVNLDMDNSGNDFTIITPRVIFQSHYLSNESIWVQFSRYSYGDKMALATSPAQPYATPDQNVFKIQANMSW